MIRFPPKKILVPFDFMAESLAAYRLAKQWAERFKSALEVAYVEDVPAAEWQLTQNLNHPSRREMLRRLSREAGVLPKLHLWKGDPAETILRLARTRRADLIVMGVHGRAGFERYWIGSTAETVIMRSPVPVLTIHDYPKVIHSVLSPVNFSDYSEYGLLYAAGIAAALKAPLTALHVVPDSRNRGNPKFQLDTMVRRIPEKVAKICRPKIETRQGIPTEEILKSAAAKRGLIVLMAHRKSLLKDWVLGTTLERVLRYSAVPVLSVPVPKSAFYFLGFPGAGQSVRRMRLPA